MDSARAELADETIPSAQDARLFAARFDAVNPCREDLLMRAVVIPRPDLAPVLAHEFAAADLEWTADIIPFHQPDMAQIRDAAARSQ